MGHYKCVMRDDWLSWLFFQRADFVSNTGYSPMRHRRCIDLMILKRSQSYLINKQRTLGILDTEFNQVNSIFAKDVTTAAIKSNAIAKEQFCRPGSCSMDQTILKRCTFDHLQRGWFKSMAKFIFWVCMLKNCSGVRCVLVLWLPSFGVLFSCS